MGETNEGDQVVLTERGKGDVTNHDHLVVPLFEGNAQVFAGVLVVIIKEFGVHRGHSARSLDESFATGIFTNRLEEFAN